MKVLNFTRGFSWASSVNQNGFAKATIGVDSFWISDCQETSIEGYAAFKGKVSGDLFDIAIHGLKLGDEVVFVPTLTDE